ncbi:MAG: hypothetical protein NW701_17390 [Nitrospira sp.]
MPEVNNPTSTPVFFTYRQNTSSDLEQGDLLSKTPHLMEVLKPIHPYYLKDDYTHFLVLTQSCDLVRRKDKCKARYVTIAAVRPLDLVIRREIEKVQDGFEQAGMVCSISLKSKITQFVGRLLNNNEPEFFYLNSEPSLGLPYPHCAFLRLSVSLKSSHYATCLNSRLLSLKEVFQAKLGWLVGNMYSRVGTEDWVPTVVSEDGFKEKIDSILDSTCQWVEEKKLKLAKSSASADLISMGQQAIRDHIAATKLPNSTELVADTVIKVLADMGKISSADESRRIKNRLTNNPVFATHTKAGR